MKKHSIIRPLILTRQTVRCLSPRETAAARGGSTGITRYLNKIFG